MVKISEYQGIVSQRQKRNCSNLEVTDNVIQSNWVINPKLLYCLIIYSKSQ